MYFFEKLKIVWGIENTKIVLRFETISLSILLFDDVDFEDDFDRI